MVIISFKRLLLLFCGLNISWILWVCERQSQGDLAQSPFDAAKKRYEADPSMDVSLSDNSLKLPNREDKNDLHSSYLMQYQPHHFVIRDGFTLPFSNLMLPIQLLIRQKWMADLRDYLYEINPNGSSPINIVSSDFKYKDVLLNWLVSATIKTQPPLRHVLVLSIDQPLHTLLIKHGIHSVYIDPQTLIRPNTLKLLKSSLRRAFKIVMMMRMVVMRLMNHWGYDVANYDIDAIILRNPTQLYYTKFNNSDLVGSKGRFPEEIKATLGLTMCAGVFMIKSTSNTGK